MSQIDTWTRSELSNKLTNHSVGFRFESHHGGSMAQIATMRRSDLSQNPTNILVAYWVELFNGRWVYGSNRYIAT